MATRFDTVYTAGLRALLKAPQTYETPTYSFFSKFLFGGQGVMTSEDAITTMYRKKTHRLISDTRRGDNAKVLNQDGKYTRKNYGVPYFFYEDSVSRPDRNTLAFGEDPANPWSQTQRQLWKMKEKVDDIRKDLDIVPEKYCTDILFTGKISPNVQEYGDIEFLTAGDADFPIADNIYTDPNGYWNADGSDIYSNLTKLVTKEWERSKRMPDTLICSLDVVEQIMKDDKIAKMLDNRNTFVGAIKPLVITADGYSEIGFISLPGCTLRVVSYLGYYNNEKGVQTNFMPDEKVILTTANIGSLNYGGLESLDAQGNGISVAGKELVTVHSNDDIPAKRTVKIQRSVLPMPERLDGWAAITVLS